MPRKSHNLLGCHYRSNGKSFQSNVVDMPDVECSEHHLDSHVSNKQYLTDSIVLIKERRTNTGVLQAMFKVALFQKTIIFLLTFSFTLPVEMKRLLQFGQYCSVLLRPCLIALTGHRSISSLTQSSKSYRDRIMNSSKQRH